jgi:orotidine-5'-phosphate decarboxylase
MNSPIILAVDTKDITEADSWISATKESIGVFKIGLELFLKIGITGTEEIIKKHGVEIFLDLKLHDIPNTVGQAVASVSGLQPRFLTIHASGGAEMVRAAVSQAGNTSITAVTILTSLNDGDLSEIGYRSGALESAVNLAALATDAGATSIVCSPFEVNAIRERVGKEIILITPGVRPADSEMGDQKRATTPQEAILNGANFVVIGRPITSYAKESLDAMSIRAAQIASALL